MLFSLYRKCIIVLLIVIGVILQSFGFIVSAHAAPNDLIGHINQTVQTFVEQSFTDTASEQTQGQAQEQAPSLQDDTPNPDSDGLAIQQTLTALPDQFSGALTYTYPIEVPPGRNGMEPNLALLYNSNDRSVDTLYGLGWRDTIPYIERDASKGVDRFYSDQIYDWAFRSSMDGELVNPDLTVTTERIYADPVDGTLVNWAFQHEATWSDVRNAAIARSGTFDAIAQANEMMLSTTNGQYEIERATIPFDTSVLPDNAVITDAKLVLHAPTFNQGNEDTYIVATDIDGSRSLQTSDYGEFSTALVTSMIEGPTIISAANNSAPIVNELNSTGINEIDGQGFTTFGIRMEFDYENREPVSNTRQWRTLYAADHPVQTQRPYLEVSYYALDDTTPDDLQYVARDDAGDFIEYEFINNEYWTARTKDGMLYTFGQDSNARQDNPNDTTQIARWMLQEIRDPHGNYVTYSYHKDQGQIYPDTITYTRFGTDPGIFEVTFNRQTRNDVTTLYNRGFKVTTQYVIDQITAYVTDQERQRYALVQDDDLNTHNTFLKSITQQGTNETGQTIAREPTVFEYQDLQTGRLVWRLSNSLAEFPFSVSGDNRTGTYAMDLNADGRIDLIKHLALETNPTVQEVYEQQPDRTWQLVPATIPSFPFAYQYDNGRADHDTRLKFGDVNADNLPDMIWSGSGQPGSATVSQKVYINKGNFTWEVDDAYVVPIEFGYPTLDLNNREIFHDFGVHLLDVNGDGFDDILQSYTDTTLRYGAPPPEEAMQKRVFINKADGTGWHDGQDITIPISTKIDPTNGLHNVDLGVRFFDVNGDGLPDAVESRIGDYGIDTNAVYINQDGGLTWELDDAYDVPVPFVDLTNFGIARNSRHTALQDFNGDGRVDILTAHDRFGFGYDGRSIHTLSGVGTGWNSAQGFDYWLQHGQPFNTADYVFPSYFVDADGDGFLNYQRDPDDFGNFTWQHTPGLLIGITNPYGARTDVTYEMLMQHKDDTDSLRNTGIPMNFPLVTQVDTTDGLGTSYTTSYIYENGQYFYDDDRPDDNTLAGFGTVTATEDDGSTTISYFHQGNTSNTAQGENNDHRSKIGRIYRTEIYDSANNLMQTTLTTWDHTPRLDDDSTLSHIVQPSQELTMTYDGNSDHRDTAISYTYDVNNGNELTRTYWGEVVGQNDASFVDIVGDKRVITTTYAASPTSNIINAPSSITLTDEQGTKVSEAKHYYDNLLFGDITIGNNTQTDTWIEGTRYAPTHMSYTLKGLLADITNPRGYSTTFDYDSDEMYPTSITNALQQITQHTYDKATGAITSIVDPNGSRYETRYDGLGRVIEQRIPELDNASQTERSMSVVYDDSSVPNKVETTVYLDDDVQTQAIQYQDGLGRGIQQRTTTEGSNTYAVTDQVYDHRGRVISQSLPYEGTNTGYTTPSAPAQLQVTTSYDTLDRPIQISNTVGTTTYSYDQWETVITDAESNQKGLEHDAYNNLIQVTEHNEGEQYITRYEYDTQDNLVKLIDAQGNIRNMTYDGLNRRLSIQDAHTPADATYGTWADTYDDVGNLLTKTSPNGDTIHYVHDELDRLTSKTLNSEVQPYETYSYDTCVNGIGRLCQDSNDTVITDYEYDTRGNLNERGRAIDATNSTEHMTHDRQSNVTFHDTQGQGTQYTYNEIGLLESIDIQPASASSFEPLISNIDYHPTQAVTSIQRANGAVTTHSYDEAELYRRRSTTTNGVSQGSGTIKILEMIVQAGENAVVTAGERITFTPGTHFEAGSTVHVYIDPDDTEPPQVGNIQDLTYTYDKVGNITTIEDTSITDTAKTIDYVYDDIYRLTTASTSNTSQDYTQTYSYDEIGNILTKSDQGTYQYNGDQGSNYANVHAVTSIDSTTYTYDKNGNLLTDGTITNTWSHDNRLISTTTGDTTITYGYDPQGIRVKKVVTQGANEEVTLTPFEHYTISPDNSTQTRIYGVGQLLATLTDDPTNEAEVHHVHTDHLGGTTKVTDEQGTIEQVLDYEPYGAIRINEQINAYDERDKYTGHEYDQESNLTYAKQRYYGQDIGRWMSQDPASLYVPEQFLFDPQQLNSYGYVRNNPMTYVDLSGTSLSDAWSFGTGVVKGAATAGWDMAKGTAHVVVLGAQSINPFASEAARDAALNQATAEITAAGEVIVYEYIPTVWNEAGDLVSDPGQYYDEVKTGYGLEENPYEAFGNDFGEAAIETIAIAGAGKAFRGKGVSYAKAWKGASLQSSINKFAPGAKGIPNAKGTKTIYSNSQTGTQVIHDTAGDYFRIKNKSGYHLDLNGNIVHAPKGMTGDTSSNYVQKNTHFNNID